MPGRLLDLGEPVPYSRDVGEHLDQVAGRAVGDAGPVVIDEADQVELGRAQARRGAPGAGAPSATAGGAADTWPLVPSRTTRPRSARARTLRRTRLEVVAQVGGELRHGDSGPADQVPVGLLLGRAEAEYGQHGTS